MLGGVGAQRFATANIASNTIAATDNDLSPKLRTQSAAATLGDRRSEQQPPLKASVATLGDRP